MLFPDAIPSEAYPSVGRLQTELVGGNAKRAPFRELVVGEPFWHSVDRRSVWNEGLQRNTSEECGFVADVLALEPFADERGFERLRVYSRLPDDNVIFTVVVPGELIRRPRQRRPGLRTKDEKRYDVETALELVRLFIKRMNDAGNPGVKQFGGMSGWVVGSVLGKARPRDRDSLESRNQVDPTWSLVLLTNGEFATLQERSQAGGLLRRGSSETVLVRGDHRRFSMPPHRGDPWTQLLASLPEVAAAQHVDLGLRG